MGNATIKDVAKAAGVSTATVSRVINNASSVRPEIRERVMRAVKELDFKPNQLARGLKMDVTHTIAIIISDISNPFFMSITREIERKVNESGYILIMVSTDDDPEKERMYIKVMNEKRVDGIVISSTGKNEDYLNSIKESGIPVVFIDRKPFRHKFDSVYVDKSHAMYDITRHLIEKGHKRIALVSGPKYIMTNFDRFTGYARALYEANILLDNNLVMYGTFSEEYGREAFRNIIEMSKRPTVIVSGSVKITRGILIEAKKMGVNIPEDISLVSYGNIDMNELITPSLTYVESLNEKIGTIAGNIILERIRNPRGDVREVVLDAKLILGKSVKQVKT